MTGTALCDVTFVIQLLNELISLGIQLASVLPKLSAKCSSTKVGAIELAKALECALGQNTSI
jgi:hypothetical protein